MSLKLGTENKTKTYAAIGLGIITLLLAIHFAYDTFISSPAPVAVSTPIPAVRPVQAPAATVQGGTPATPFAHQAIEVAGGSALDPTLHPEWMAQAESTTYTGEGRNIFSANSAPNQVATPIEKPHAPIRPVAVAQGPPPPPNIDLKFYGYTKANGVTRACLLHGDDIFLAHEGDIVDRRYKVVKISAFSIDVEDLPFSHTQTLPLLQN